MHVKKNSSRRGFLALEALLVLPIVGCGIPPEVYHRTLEDIVVLLER